MILSRGESRSIVLSGVEYHCWCLCGGILLAAFTPSSKQPEVHTASASSNAKVHVLVILSLVATINEGQVVALCDLGERKEDLPDGWPIRILERMMTTKKTICFCELNSKGYHSEN